MGNEVLACEKCNVPFVVDQIGQVTTWNRLCACIFERENDVAKKVREAIDE